MLLKAQQNMHPLTSSPTQPSSLAPTHPALAPLGAAAENVGFLLYEHSDLPEVQIKALVVDSLAKVGVGAWWRGGCSLSANCVWV